MVKQFLAIMALLAVTALCYSTGISNYFLLDDGVNITKNPAIHITDLKTSSLELAAISGNAGLGNRPISMLTFALNHYISGLNAKHFKLVNLSIHLLNGLLVFVFFKLLLTLSQKNNGGLKLPEKAIFLVALFVTALWLLHPLNLTSVLYVVQRMTSLSAFFVLLGLTLYVFGRKKLLEDKALQGLILISSSILLATPLAVLSKENGVLLPIYILLIEVTLLRWQTASDQHYKILKLGISLSVFIPTLLGLLYLVNNPSIVTAGYLFRDFTMVERLMTEARVLWLYIYQIMLPNISMLGLYHDDIVISKSLFNPASTAISVFGLLAMAGAAFKWRHKHPVIAFGIGFFLIGHSLESSIFPLEIAYEHRNYLPALGILFIISYYVVAFDTPTISLRKRLSFLSFLVLLMLGVTSLRAYEWKDPFKMRLLEVQRHPLSARAHASIAGVYDNMPGESGAEYADFYFKAAEHYQQAANLSDNDTTGLFGLVIINARRDLPIEETQIALLENKLRTVPFSPPNVNALIGTERCYMSGKCFIQPEIMNRLFVAALANPTLQGGNRSMVLMSFSKVVFQEDKQHAIELVEEAIKLAPHIMGNRLAFVDLLIASGELNRAAIELKRTKTLSDSEPYENTINALESMIDNQIKKPRE